VIARAAALAVLLLCACATQTSQFDAIVAAQNRRAEETGSPWRMTVQQVGGGTVVTRALLGSIAPSAADDALRADALVLVGRAEATQGRVPDVTLQSTRSWPDPGEAVREIWLIDSPSRKGLVYVLRFTPSPQAGTEIDVKGPF
jgi:hypothetical protein